MFVQHLQFLDHWELQQLLSHLLSGSSDGVLLRGLTGHEPTWTDSKKQEGGVWTKEKTR